MKIHISQIHVGSRVRRDMGNIAELAQSISELGLLHPVVVDAQHNLIAGSRRLEACRKLGWDQIPVTVAESIQDVVKAAQAERDENTCRKPFSHSEAVAAAEKIEKFEAELAKARQAAGQNNGRTSRKLDGDKLAPSNRTCHLFTADDLPEPEQKPEPIERAKTRERVAAAVGVSHGTLTKARAVTAKGAPELIEAMDRREVSPHAAAAVAELPHARQVELVKAGPKAVIESAKEYRQRVTVEKLKSNPCEIVIERWTKSIHDALVPVNSVRRDLGGGKEWARTFDKINLKKMANELDLVIKAYQGWLKDINEVLNENE
jgi:ParB-like chromosome segregation protein Spo0J